MESSKIIHYIFNFSPKQQTKFLHFVQSPYYNQHQPTIQLLEHILSQAEKKKKKLDKEYVFKKLYPGKTYNEQRLFNLLSNLKKLLNRFLAVSYLEENPKMEALLTVETTHKHQQFDLMLNRAKQLEKQLGKRSKQDENYHYVRYRLDNVLGYHRGVYADRSNAAPLQKMMHQLDRYYILEKLSNSCHLVANTMLMNTQYDWGLLDIIQNYIVENKELYQDDIAIWMYQTVLKSLQDSHNPAHYEQMKEYLHHHIDSFTQSEQEHLYLFSYNYCILQVNRGNAAYLEELFELYQRGLSSQLIYNNGILSEWDYKNIATLGAKLEKFEWTEWFINNQRTKLAPTHRENAYQYSLAYLHYTKGKYREVLSNLLHVQYTDVQYHLSSSFLLLRTYYKMKDTEALLSLIETFRIYVLRNRQMTADKKKGYFNFLKLVKKLVLLKHDYHAYSKSELNKKLEELNSQINDTENLINRSWLVEELAA